MDDTSLLFVNSSNRDTVLFPSGNSYTLHLTTPIRNITKVDLVCANIPSTSYNLTASSNIHINDSSNVVMLPGFYSAATFCNAFNNSNQTDVILTVSDTQGTLIFYGTTLSNVRVSGELANIIGFTFQTSFAASSNPVYANDTTYTGNYIVKSPKIANFLGTNDYVCLDVEELRTPTSIDAKNIVTVDNSTNNISYSTVTTTVPLLPSQTLPLLYTVPSQSNQMSIDLPVDYPGINHGDICTTVSAPVTQITYGLPKRPIAWTEVTCNKNGIIVAVGHDYHTNTGYIEYSTDGILWVISYSSSDLITAGVGCSPTTGRFVVIGTSTTLLLYSDDGKNWNQATIDYSDISAYGLVPCSPATGMFIISNFWGDTSSNTYIYSITNGVDWVNGVFPTNDSDNYVVAVNAVGRFVALGSSHAYYSDNGINWKTITTPSYYYASVVCSPTGRWVAIGRVTGGVGRGVQTTNQGIYSNNGKTWNIMTLPGPAQSWFNVTCNPVTGRFVAVSYAYAGIYSDDGIHWSPINDHVGSIITCNPISGQFVTIPFNGGGSIYYSNDNGIQWVSTNAQPTFTLNDYLLFSYSTLTGIYVAVDNTTIYYSNILYNWTAGYTYSAAFIPSYITCSPTTGRFVIAGYYDNPTDQTINICLYSDDGKIWHEVTLPTSDKWICVTCSPSGLFVMSSGYQALHSVDGTNWIASTPPAGKTFGNLACNPSGLFICAGGTGGLYSDDNANTWKNSDLPTDAGASNSNGITGLVACSPSGIFVAIAITTGNLYYSSNGQTWLSGVNHAGIPDSFTCTSSSVLTCSPITGRFIFIYGDMTVSEIYSDNGIDWYATTGPNMDGTVSSVTCNLGRFIAISNYLFGSGPGYGTNAQYSDDGSLWYPITTTATIAYTGTFPYCASGTPFTFTPTTDTVSVNDIKTMMVGDYVQGYTTGKVVSINGTQVTFQTSTPQIFPFIYAGSQFVTYRYSNVSVQTYSSYTPSTSFALIPLDVPAGFVKIFKENTDYKMSVTYPSRIDKLSRVTVRWLDKYGHPISFNTFDENSFTLRIHSTRKVPEVERLLTLPAPVEVPKKQNIIGWISIAVLILGLLIITFMKNR